jgi:two-component system CheB/CheR fusion protein
MNKKKIAKAKTKRSATKRKNASKTVVPPASSSFAPAPSDTPPEQESFPVGASAGGLKAFEQFFTHMPADSAMAFILIPHLDPTHKSIPADLIKRYMSMYVVQIEDGMKVKPSSVYIIPPNKDVSIQHGTLQLLVPAAPRGLRHPIDSFFRFMMPSIKSTLSNRCSIASSPLP